MNHNSRVKDLVKKNSESICLSPGDGLCVLPKHKNTLLKGLSINRDHRVRIKTIDDVLDEVDCDSPECLHTKSTSSKTSKLLRRIMKPKGSVNGNEWVNSDQIEKILDNWEYMSEKKFYSMNYATIDFETCNNPNFEKIKKVTIDWLIKNNKQTSAAIINTDTCDGGGQHWFPIFIDLRKDCILLEYYNSVNKRMPNNICEFFNKLKTNYENLNTGDKKRKIKICSYRPAKHQNENSECGIYSLYYIRSRLDGIPGEDIINTPLSDNLIHEFRKALFINKN